MCTHIAALLAKGESGTYQCSLHRAQCPYQGGGWFCPLEGAGPWGRKGQGWETPPLPLSPHPCSVTSLAAPCMAEYPTTLSWKGGVSIIVTIREHRHRLPPCPGGAQAPLCPMPCPHSIPSPISQPCRSSSCKVPPPLLSVPHPRSSHQGLLHAAELLIVAARRCCGEGEELIIRATGRCWGGSWLPALEPNIEPDSVGGVCDNVQRV